MFFFISYLHITVFDGGDDDGGHQGSDFRIIGASINNNTHKILIYYLIATEKKLDVTL